MKYKLLTIADLLLTAQLESQAGEGFELIEVLEKVLPNSQSDFVGWRVLLGKADEPVTKAPAPPTIGKKRGRPFKEQQRTK